MKKFSLLIAIVLIINLFSTFFVFADEEENNEPGLLYDFYYEWDPSWDYLPETMSSTQCDLEYENNSLKISMHGRDPNFYLEILGDIELEDFPFIKMKLKNESATSSTFEIYVVRDDEPITEENAFHHEIGKEHEDFRVIVIDATKVKGKNWWKGALTGLRFDGLRNANEDGGDVLYLEYIGLFASQEAADRFEPNREQTPPLTKEPTPEPTKTPEPEETEVVDKKETKKPEKLDQEKDGKANIGLIIFIVKCSFKR